MYKLILFLFLVCLWNPIFAQSTIKYLDFNYQEIKKRDAIYEMTESVQNDSIYKTIRYKGKETIKAIIAYSINEPNYKFQREFSSKGFKLNEGWFNDGKKQGPWFYYNERGTLIQSKQFEQNNEIYYTSFFPNGQKRKEVGVRKGEYDGLCTYYNKQGDTILQGNYKKSIRVDEFQHFYSASDSVISELADTNHAKDSFLAVETMPKFPGGEAAMMQYIINNLDYPEEAKDRGIEGKVMIRFTVRKDGFVYDAMPVSTDILGYGCERACIELIENMPDWSPGMSLGKPVKVYFNIPLRFKLY